MHYLKKLGLFIFTSILSVGFAVAGVLSDISEYIDDSSITTVINMKYTKDPVLNAFKIHVKTKDNRVKLTGLVDSDMQYERATTLARLTSGVKSVDTRNLRVKKSDQVAEDLLITTQIKGHLLHDQMLNDLDISNVEIETKNGVVFIKATVNRNEKIGEVLNTIYSVHGVKKVKTDIDVR